MNTDHLVLRQMLAVVLLISCVACTGNATRESAGEYIDNSAITARVKADLARSDKASALAIEVKTFKGTVQLSGFVDSEAERKAAESIAKNVDGVRAVENALIVK